MTTHANCSPIVELRQYTLHPGCRDGLIDLFDSSFVEPQEEAGMKVIGQFRDLDDSDRFVWLRGFPDMPGRARSLAEFYDGPVWRAHHEEANAAMVDSDDVLLLRPARPRSAFALARDRPPRGLAGGRPGGFVAATIMHLEAPAQATEVVSYFELAVVPAVSESGGSILAYFVTEPHENTFPRLPVRENEQVFVWFAGFRDRPTLERMQGAESRLGRITAEAPALTRPPQILRLVPTTRSLLRGSSTPCRAGASASEV